jgi:phospho-N-acetylmuramoyl-pentapeptide-transferase
VNASTPTAFAIAAGAAIAAALLPWLIDAQRRRRAGQVIYEDAPRSHEVKAGTPTLGGVVFIPAAIAGFFIGHERALLPLLALVVAAGLIGLADDLLILRTGRAVGLRAREKMALLLLAALGYVLWTYAAGFGGPRQTWFAGSLALPLWLWYVLAVAAVVGAANAVNLTDGLDGLAAGTSVPAIIGVQLTAYYVGLPGGGAIADAVLGALLVFLWFNRHPARIFMGDAGSLALGALLAGCAIEGHALLLLPLFGIVFVAEALSVIAQVASFQTTGRRILKMSPLHHHFELSGWRETAVTWLFVACGTLAAAATWTAWMASNKA